MKINTFHYVMAKGIMGAIIGILAGLALGILIWALEMGVIALSNSLSGMNGEFGNLPLAVITLPSMCLGALIGSMHGAAVAIKEEKKK